MSREVTLAGPELRARNLGMWLKSMSPDEYPLKLGDWRKVIKKLPATLEAARNRK